MNELEKIEESPSKEQSKEKSVPGTPSSIREVSGIFNENNSNEESGTDIKSIDGSTETKNKSVVPKGKLHWNDQTEDLLVGWADIAACYKWLHESSFRKLSRKNSWYTIPVIVLSTLTGAANLSLGTFVPTDFTNVAQAGIAGVNIIVGILMTLQTKFRYAEDSETHFNVSLGWSKLQRNIAIELSVDRQHRKEADYFIRNCRTDYDRLLEQSPTIPEEVIELFKQEMKKEKEMKSKIEKKKRELMEKKKIEKKKKKKKKKNCSNLFGLFQDDEDDDEDDDKDDGIFIEDENEKLIIPDICGNVRHTKIYKSVLQGNNNIIDTTIKAGRDLDDQQNTPILPVIKNTLQDRINELDERISGVNQFKLAQIGQRLAPLNNLMIETHHMSQVKNLQNAEQLTSRNMRNERDTRQQINIKTREPLGSIGMSDTLGMPHDFREQKQTDFILKKNLNEAIDTRYDRDTQIKNKIPPFRRDSRMQGFSYMYNNERDIGREIPRKGTVKDLINRFKNPTTIKTEEEMIPDTIGISDSLGIRKENTEPISFRRNESEERSIIVNIKENIEVDNPLKDENLNDVRENSIVSVYNESPSIISEHSVKNDVPQLDLNNVISEITIEALSGSDTLYPNRKDENNGIELSNRINKNKDKSERSDILDTSTENVPVSGNLSGRNREEKTMRSNSIKNDRLSNRFMRNGTNLKGDSDSLRESEYNNSNVVSPRKSVSQKFNNNIEPSTGNFPDSNLGIIGTMKVNTPKSTNKSDIVLVFKD